MGKTANFVGINLPWVPPEILTQTYPGKVSDPVLGVELGFFFFACDMLGFSKVGQLSVIYSNGFP